MTNTLCRKKPTSAVKDKADPANKETYALLVQACIASIINRPDDIQQGRQTILISLPYFAKRAKDFPAGILVSKTAATNIYKIRVKALLDWLHKKGYSTFSYNDVTRGMLAFSRDLATLERQLEFNENTLDTELDVPYNGSSLDTLEL